MTENRSFLARHKSFLLGAVTGFAALGVIAGTHLSFTPTTPAVAQATQGLAAQPGFADLVEKVKPAVVSVKVRTRQNVERMSDDGGFGDPMERFFRQFGFGDEDQMRGQRPRGPRFGMSQGSGFFISADGYVVTNNHVVDNATEVDVTMDDGTTLTAKVIGTDPRTDLALLKVEGRDDLPFVDLAAATPRIGDWVIAVGNPFGLGGTVTAGIVSARGRDIGSGPYDDFLQIDAAVNRGNSGGPTFDLQGNVVGVNTAIFSPSGGNVGIAFAIPAETVKQVVDELRADGKVTRGWIGVRIQPVTPEIAEATGLPKPEGAIVAEATAQAPAAEAGLRAGDTITAVNGETISDPRDLAKTIAALEPGRDVEVTYWRDGRERTASIKLGTLPAPDQRAALEPGDQPGEDGADRPAAVASLGLTVTPATQVPGAGDRGVVITDVQDGSKAAEQLRAGDVVLEVGGTAVNSPREMRRALDAAKEGGRRSVLMLVKNGDNTRFVALPVG